MVAPHDINWFPVVAAAILTAALGIVFLNPAWQAAPVVDRPSVLGQTTHPAYETPVVVHAATASDATTVRTSSPSLLAILAAMATAHDTTFVYRTRGTGAYLDEFYGMRNDVTGRWIIKINDIEVTDLSADINDGDTVTALRSTSL